MNLSSIHLKIKTDKELSEKEIDFLIDEHWLEWTCKYNLSPLGDLTVIGKREYLKDNKEEILELINEFPEALEC